jgi:SAM-dependent methyltransferase
VSATAGTVLEPPAAVGGEGERFVDAAPRNWELFYQHVARYRFARRFAAGRVVLDVACGSGYGSALLGERARAVIGADLSRPALAHAAAHHGGSGARYVRMDGCRLGLRDGSVDLVVSFETLEHVPDMPLLLRELRRVLKPGGLLIISTPNRPLYAVYNKGRRNPFHHTELIEEEFRALLAKEFTIEQVVGQRHFAGRDLVLTAPYSDGPVPMGPDGFVRRALRVALRVLLPESWRARHWLDAQIWANKCSLGEVPPAHAVYMVACAQKSGGR